MPITQNHSRTDWLLCAFLFGFISLVYEVYSLKVIFFYFTENAHAIAIALSSFLAGLAFSSLIFSRVVQKYPDKGKQWLSILQILSIVYALTVLRNFFIIPQGIDAISNHFSSSPTITFVAKILIIWIFLFIPAFLLGGGFPIFNGLYLKNFESRFSDIGTVYFWDTCGAILGSLLTGFLLIPAFGLVGSLYLPVAISAGIVFWLAKNRRQQIILILIFIAMAAGLYMFEHSRVRSSSPVKADLIPYERRFGKILFQEHSPFGIVTVGQRNDDKTTDQALFINYREMCSVKDHISEKEIGSLTAVNLPPESNVLNIGLGCGFTAQALNESANVRSINVIEINPVVIKAATQYFATFTNHVLQSSKITLRNADGADIIRTGTGLYDAIVIDIEEPGVIQSSPIYTVEYIRMAKERLKPDGIFTIWAIRGNTHYNQILENTLKAVFKNVYYRGQRCVQFYASDRTLDIKEDTRVGWREEFDTINTLDNRALEKSYSIRESFDLPVWHQDPFIRQ